MNILLATGIYPPAIGGPATYVERLAGCLHRRGIAVTVVTYARTKDEIAKSEWPVVRVPTAGGPLMRWNRYAKALQSHGRDADIIEAFSAVSAGVPLSLSRLKQPKRVLRLGGDFLWERYTDLGGRLNLRSFYHRYPATRASKQWLLRSFHHIAFSTEFQRALYERAYRRLPPHSVIENAIPEGEPVLHARHEPLRLLFFGRFVRFKNLLSLLAAVSHLPHVRLTIVGEGPLLPQILRTIDRRGIGGRVTLREPVSGEAKQALFLEHDLLVLPSLTEISPQAAIEARSMGLPVLLTRETGLSPSLAQGMILRPLRTPSEITKAILEAEQGYEAFASAASAPFEAARSWDDVTEEHLQLFRKLV